MMRILSFFFFEPTMVKMI